MTTWTLDQLAFVARWTIWPLLHPLISQVEEVARLVRLAVAQVQAIVPPTLPAPLPRLQEINFSCLNGAVGSFVGRADVVATLNDAHLLYRAVGGESIITAILSSVPVGGEPVSLQIEIRRTDYTRAAATSFSTPIVFLSGPTADPVVLSPNMPLNAGDCLVAAELTTWAGTRVDGTLIISR